MIKFLITGLIVTVSLFAVDVNSKDDLLIKHDDFVSKDSHNFSKELANDKQIAYKEGFLTSKECAVEGKFRDCGLDSFERSEMVLYVHAENKVYSFNMNNQHKLDSYEHAINRNNVKIFGNINTKKSIITVAGLSVALPEDKPFFKGCL